MLIMLVTTGHHWTQVTLVTRQKIFDMYKIICCRLQYADDTYRADVDDGLVSDVVVAEDGGLHLPASVGQVDPLPRHQLGAGVDVGEAWSY